MNGIFEYIGKNRDSVFRHGDGFYRSFFYLTLGNLLFCLDVSKNASNEILELFHFDNDGLVR